MNLKVGRVAPRAPPRVFTPPNGARGAARPTQPFPVREFNAQGFVSSNCSPIEAERKF